MQIAVVSAPGEVELRETQPPSCGPGQLLVELGGCGLCTFDRRLFSGETPVYPTAAGHEPAGRVIEVGQAVAGLPGTPRLGDLVTLDMRTRCGTCSACRRGRSAICLAAQSQDRADGLISIAGGLAEVIAVGAEHAWAVADMPIGLGPDIICVVPELTLSATYRPTVSALRAAGIPKSGRHVWYFDTASEQYRRLTPAVRAELSATYRGTDG